jgi:hypothetical protein
VCLAELHEAPDPKNQLHSNFFSQTHPTPAAPPRICSKKRWSRPQLHGFRGVPQGVLHQIQVSCSWGKLPTITTSYTKKVRSSFFLSLPPASPLLVLCRPHLSSPCRPRASSPLRGRARPVGGVATPAVPPLRPPIPVLRHPHLPSPCCDAHTSPPRATGAHASPTARPRARPVARPCARRSGGKATRSPWPPLPPPIRHPNRAPPVVPPR